MSLVNKKPPTPHHIVCHVCQALTDLPPSESQALLDMLNSKEWRSTWIEDALREEGITTVSDRSITRHRLGRCLGTR